jgi:hypothetical protein
MKNRKLEMKWKQWLQKPYNPFKHSSPIPDIALLDYRGLLQD